MNAPQTFEFTQGDSPLLVSMPHVGEQVPSEILANFTQRGQALPDTDWYVHRLYDFLPSLGVSSIQANYSRYLIDLNRSPDNKSMYPGQNVTQISTTSLFDNQPLYVAGTEPSAADIAQRTTQYWQPYHQKVEEELARIKQRFGYALLWDAHSIKNIVPRFFDGQLPDFNWGNANHRASSAELLNSLHETVLAEGDYSSVCNGRFKGGYITRQYGSPEHHIHAVQLELSQITYMPDQNSFEYSEQRAAQVKPLIKKLVQQMISHPFTRD